MKKLLALFTLAFSLNSFAETISLDKVDSYLIHDTKGIYQAVFENDYQQIFINCDQNLEGRRGFRIKAWKNYELIETIDYTGLKKSQAECNDELGQIVKAIKNGNTVEFKYSKQGFSHTLVSGIDCEASDKEIATKILDSSRLFEDDRVTIDMVKKKVISVYENNFQIDTSYCVTPRTSIINWAGINDSELNKDGDESIKCISSRSINELKASSCPLD